MSDANLLLEPEQLDQDRASVEGEAYRHLFRARRLGVDDSLRVFDGSGRARRAIVESVDRHRAILRLGEVAPSREPEMAVGIAAATLRPERASWLVEKVTEVGVSTISFFNCRRAPRSPGAGQLERWNRMARAAAEQCGRALVPPVELLPDFDRLLERVGERRTVVLDPGAPALASAAEAAKADAERALADRTGEMEVAEAQAKLLEAVAQLQAMEQLRKNLRR